MAHEIAINAKNHKIDAVTVYQTDRAVIQRTFPVVLKVILRRDIVAWDITSNFFDQRGQNHVAIKGLPPSLDSDSLRIEVNTKSATHGLTVIEVLHMPPSGLLHSRHPYKTSDDSESPELTTLREELADLEMTSKIVSTQTKALSEYARKFGVDTSTSLPVTASPGELEAFLAIYEPRRLGLYQKHKNVRKHIKETAKKIKDIEDMLIETSNIDKRWTGVKVTLRADEKGPADLVMNYGNSNLWITVIVRNI